MKNSDRYDSRQDLTHEQATNTNEKSEQYQQGYSRGYWQQPEPGVDASPDYKAGYQDGYNHRSMDSN